MCDVMFRFMKQPSEALRNEFDEAQMKVDQAQVKNEV